jgi:hypothetical protein
MLARFNTTEGYSPRPPARVSSFRALIYRVVCFEHALWCLGAPDPDQVCLRPSEVELFWPHQHQRVFFVVSGEEECARFSLYEDSRSSRETLNTGASSCGLHHTQSLPCALSVGWPQEVVSLIFGKPRLNAIVLRRFQSSCLSGLMTHSSQPRRFPYDDTGVFGHTRPHGLPALFLTSFYLGFMKK